VKSVVYTSTPKLAPGASSPAAILPAKSTSAEDAKLAKSTSAEDTKLTKSTSAEDVKLANSTSAEDTKLTKSTSVEDTNLAKSTSAEDTRSSTPAGKTATKPAKAAHGFHARLADKAAVEPTNEVDIQTHGRAAGQSTTEVGIRSPEQPREYIPAVRTAFKSASSSAKQSTTSEAAGKQPLASNTEVRVNYQLWLG